MAHGFWFKPNAINNFTVAHQLSPPYPSRQQSTPVLETILETKVTRGHTPRLNVVRRFQVTAVWQSDAQS
jgi:hypothetical protein